MLVLRGKLDSGHRKLELVRLHSFKDGPAAPFASGVGECAVSPHLDQRDTVAERPTCHLASKTKEEGGTGDDLVAIASAAEKFT